MSTNQSFILLRKNALLIAFYIVVLLFVMLIGPKYAPDSFAHFDMLINRSVLYSIFLNIPYWLFGIKMGVTIVIIQFILYVFAVNILIKNLTELLKLQPVSVLTLHVVFAYLALFTYQVINYVLSESLAYVFLLTLLAIGIAYYRSPKTKTLGLLWSACLLLLLTRIQFIIVLPILSCLFIYHYKTILKSYLNILLIIAILSSPFFCKQLESLYYKMVLNEDIGYSMTYVHLSSAPFFISEKSDEALFENPEEKAFFRRTKQLLDNQNLSLDYCYKAKEDEFNYYQKNFTKICNAVIHEANMDYYKSLGLSFYDQHRKVNQLTEKMFYPLIKKHFVNWVKLTLKGFKKGLFGSQGLLLVGLLLIGCLFLFKNNYKEFSLLILSLMTMKIMLHLFIAMSVHSIHRYLFYFDWVIPMFLIVLIDYLVTNGKTSLKTRESYV